MKKKFDILITVIMAIAFVVGLVLVVYISGNPVTRIKIRLNCDKYVEENYPQLKEQLKRKIPISYSRLSPEDRRWGVFYSDPEDNLVYFSLSYNEEGRLTYDGCAEEYLKGANIVNFYNVEYSEKVNRLARGTDFVTDFTFSPPADKMLSAALLPPGSGNPDAPVLPPDGEYTADELAATYGMLSLSCLNDEYTEENALARLEQLRAFMLENNIPAANVNLFMQDYSLRPVSITARRLAGDSWQEQISRIFENP